MILMPQVSAPIPDELTTVSWCDGDNLQIDSITADDGIESYAEHKALVNKHNASGTEKEQAADLEKGFSIFKKLSKTATLEHVPPTQHQLKFNIMQVFLKYSNHLQLGKEAAIVDYLAKQQLILSRACVRENIIAGYVANGFIDVTCRTLPVFQKIVSTCKKITTVDDFKLYSLTFNALMNYSCSQGNASISDHAFMSHWFPADINAYGN
jgi:hypothetical protein